MSMYAEIETNLLAQLQADAGLSAVKTFESDLREALFEESKLAKGFEGVQLPAISVSAHLAPTKSTPFSAGETSHVIPVTAVVITRNMRKKTALSEAIDLAERVEAVLEGARRSDGRLGANVFVTGEIVWNSTVVSASPYSYALVSVEAQVLKIVEAAP